jgi:hypothetical protein
MADVSRVTDEVRVAEPFVAVQANDPLQNRRLWSGQINGAIYTRRSRPVTGDIETNRNVGGAVTGKHAEKYRIVYDCNLSATISNITGAVITVRDDRDDLSSAALSRGFLSATVS